MIFVAALSQTRYVELGLDLNLEGSLRRTEQEVFSRIFPDVPYPSQSYSALTFLRGALISPAFHSWRELPDHVPPLAQIARHLSPRGFLILYGGALELRTPSFARVLEQFPPRATPSGNFAGVFTLNALGWQLQRFLGDVRLPEAPLPRVQERAPIPPALRQPAPPAPLVTENTVVTPLGVSSPPSVPRNRSRREPETIRISFRATLSPGAEFPNPGVNLVREVAVAPPPPRNRRFPSLPEDEELEDETATDFAYVFPPILASGDVDVFSLVP